MLHRPLKRTKPAPAVNGKPTPDETIYASSSSSGLPLNPRLQSLPRATESNESLNPYNQHGTDILDDEKNGVEVKRSLSEELDDEEAFIFMRSMWWRRKRSPTPEAVLKECSEPVFTNEFKGPSDLTKHEKVHIWPWSCQGPLCKHHEYRSSSVQQLFRDHFMEKRLRSQGNPYISSLNTKPHENRRKVLRVRIKDKDHLACPDSGSEKNIISKACAVEHGFRIRRKANDKKRFEVGNGDIVWSIGRVFETVGLPGSPFWQKKRWFYVLENCPVPLVMGMEFLREAEILTKYRHLLENCPAEMSNIPSLLWIGSPRNRLRCTIDGRQLEAVADTGSDLNLMSLACAEREGFRIDRRMEARTQIEVGSGKVIETLGQVYVSNLTLDWREPEAEPPKKALHTPTTNAPLEPDPHESTYPPQGEGDDEFYIPFHVMENLPCDIIFGHKFLDDTDAFNKCPELLHIPPTKHNRQLEKHKQQFEFMVFRSKTSSHIFSHIFSHIGFSKKPKLVVDVEKRHESDWFAERHRRSKNTEEKIALLPPGDREAARRSEAKKVRDWNTEHASCRSCKTRSTT